MTEPTLDRLRKMFGVYETEPDLVFAAIEGYDRHNLRIIAHLQAENERLRAEPPRRDRDTMSTPKYSNGRTAKVGDEVISAHGTTKYIAVIDTFTNAVGYLGYWASAGEVTDVLPDGTVVVFRDEVGFNDPTGHRYSVAAKHLLVAGDS